MTAPSTWRWEFGGKVLLSALWLYPPGDGAATSPRTEAFVLHLLARDGGRLIDERLLEAEYGRLARAVIHDLADPTDPARPEL